MAEADVHQADPDVRLMLALRDGDDSAFDALFRRWAGPLLHYLERLVHDAASAEELVQESFLRVYRARERYEPDARFSTWLYTIASRLAFNERRRSHRRHPHRPADPASDVPALELPAPQAAIDDVVHARRSAGAVARALDELPERQRAALWLSAVEGLSYAEVARSLETTEKSVKALVHRARASLADGLKGEEVSA